MKGYPKHLNTRTDYEYVRTHFSKADYKQDFQNLLNTMQMWVTTGELPDADSGINDATHQVVPVGDEQNPKYIQQELQENPNCKLFQLGYTEAEVRQIVGE